MARPKLERKTEEEEERFPHPRRIAALEGHKDARRLLAEGLKSGKLHHGWLIAGGKGIGKASLAYLFAKYVLAEGTNFFETFAVSQENLPAYRKVAGGTHPDLLTVEAGVSEGKKTRDINVDDVRRVKDFLALTPAESAWRVVLIDSADDLNPNAANALLKLLEEPPANALMLLVSHSPGRLLPTIRSRCRVLRLNPLSAQESASVLAQNGVSASPALVSLAKGAPGLALWLEAQGWEGVYRKLLTALTGGDVAPLAAAAGEKDQGDAWELFTFLLSESLARAARLAAGVEPGAELATGEREALNRLAKKHGPSRLVELRETLLAKTFEAGRFYLDKKLALEAAFSEIT